jgi:hypothetical protein
VLLGLSGMLLGLSGVLLGGAAGGNIKSGLVELYRAPVGNDDYYLLLL